MILAAALALALRADGGIQLPPWPLSPDGERVAVLGESPLEAEHAQVVRETGRIWRVFPEPGVEAVGLRAGATTLRAAVGPRPGRIEVTIDPPAPIKGRDRAIRLRLEAKDEAGGPLALEAPPLVSVSVGRLGAVSPAGGPGRFEASWEPSDGAEPEVLGVVALAPRCPLCATPRAAGVARFPVSAAIDLPGRSDPGVETRVEIAGRSFGPVRADGDGRFVVPSIVPPGTRWATATSQSAVGNARRTRIDLRLSESPAFHCAQWPAEVAAGGGSDVGIRCVAWTGSGAPVDPGLFRASAGGGTIAATGVEGDAWWARYRPPAGAAGSDRITVQLGAVPPASADRAVALAAGPPSEIGWTLEGEPAAPGSRLKATATVRDPLGRPLGEASAPDGALQGGLLQIRREYGDGRQRVALAFALPSGDAPASLHLRRDGSRWIAAVRDVRSRPVPGVEVRFGSGGAGRTDERGEVRGGAGGSTETVVGPAGLRAAAWADAPTPAPPVSIARDVVVSLRPPGSIDVDATLRGGLLRWIVRGPDGAALPSRAVGVTADGAQLGPIERDGEGGRCRVLAGKGTVSVTDTASGATAVLEVP